MRPRETLTESQEERLLQVRLACPDITRACDLARTFADLVRHRRGHLLLEWIRQAEQDAPKPMSGFAGFLRRDLDAVTAGLTLPWSSGVVLLTGHPGPLDRWNRYRIWPSVGLSLRSVLRQVKSEAGRKHGRNPEDEADSAA
ncbi:hypothetical protein [Streptomyces sp. NPDC002537]